MSHSSLWHWQTTLSVLALSVLSALNSGAVYADTVNLGHGVNMELWGAQKHGTTTQRIDHAKTLGFTFIRLGVPISLWLKDAARPREVALGDLAAAVAHARANRMSVLISLFMIDAPGGLTAGRMICGSRDAQQRYRAGVDEVLAILPDTEDVAFEPLNEPSGGCSPMGTGTATGTAWSAMQWDIYQTFRSKKPHLTFIVDGGAWGDLDGLLAFDPTPYVADRHTVMSFHYYDPKLFTHQGLTFTNVVERFAQHVPWPTEEPRLTVARANTLRAIDEAGLSVTEKRLAQKAALDAFARYREEGTVAHLETRFQAASDWASKYGLEPQRILVGEVGVARSTHDTTGTPPEDADRYLLKVRAVAEMHHFSWAIWDLDGGFAILCGNPLEEGMCPAYHSVLMPSH